jgi:toxin HigB-1
MIKSFKHKGLERFFTGGDRSGINSNQIGKLKMILQLLDEAEIIQDMNFPGSRLHPHKGIKDIWSVDVSGNYRIIFKFINGNAYIIDYSDPH